MTDAELYEHDFIGWSQSQARRLREAAAGMSNLDLDWEHLAEEIEGVGLSEYHAVTSMIATVIEHLLKLEFSPASEPRRGWMSTVVRARADIERRLDDSPGLRPRIDQMVARERPRAARLVAREMDICGEADRALITRLRERTFTTDEVISDWFPEPAGVGSAR